MKNKRLVTFILGTRPEAIKMAPVILEFKSSNLLNTRVVLTGQHRDMVFDVLKIFNIKEDLNLNIMDHGQTLTHITNSILTGLEYEFDNFRPDLVLVQGDTTTTFSASLASFYKKIPIAHIEAGLRTNNLDNPFPEEANRRLISQLANLHFAPTEKSKENLINNGVTGKIIVTGNSVIDALIIISKQENKNILEYENYLKNKDLILATVHRRENWGDNIKKIAYAIKKILDNHTQLVVLIPMHLNPIVREPIISILGSEPRAILTEPMDYRSLVCVINRSTLVLTDSGGLQEEAPSLGKPVLVLRETTERQEAIEAGTAKLVGTDSENIFNNVKYLLKNEYAYNQMAKAINPFGDGKTSQRILKECLTLLLV